MINKLVLYTTLICTICANGYSTQRPSKEDESNPFLDLASSFLQETLANQNGNGGGGGLGAVASLIGNLMQTDGKDGSGRAGGGGGAAVQILSGLGSLMANANNGNGFDPSMLGNIIEMFTAGGNEDSGDNGGRQKRSSGSPPSSGQQEGIGLETILNIASTFINSNNVANGKTAKDEDGLISYLPMIMQVVNSFSGPEGEKVYAKHKDHAWVLPPFLEKVHVMWDHFSNSELADALWKKSGVHSIFKVKFVIFLALFSTIFKPS